ncbi:MAG: PIN domain-containing protein [Undibacterium umbellatum]|uniref:PIN domain-containing protein n=1 Tax=Undibacterium umbellatum TaxID=2762300 RepID=UPI003BB5C601
MSVDINTIAQQISHDPKPLVLIDTCSLLDVVRVPIREENNATQIILGALKLLDLALQNKVYLAITSIVRAELESNLGEVRDEVLKLATRREKQVQHYVLCSKLAGLALQGADAFAIAALRDKLTDMVFGILAKSFEIKGDDACSGRAMKRVITNQAPASKGKNEAKDCDIIEHYLELAGLLRQSGFSKAMCFVTANSNDYGKPGEMRSPLDAQLKAWNIEYVNNFQWTVGLVS